MHFIGSRYGIYAILIITVSCKNTVQQPEFKVITNEQIKEWSAPYRNWHYYPELVIAPNPAMAGYDSIRMTDVPTVYQIPEQSKYYMTFIGFDGQGYQSFVVESDDLITWDNYQLAMGYGPEGTFDYGGVVLGAYLYENYDVKAPRMLKKQNDFFYSLYGAYPRQGGYELRPGYEGIAKSHGGVVWERAKDEPILSIYQDDCEEWEQSCIYQPWLLEKGGEYFNFYNAANEQIEQIGLARSQNLLDWKRHPKNPVIPHGSKGSYNEVFSSDGKVFWDKDHWVMFFFGVGRGGAHIMAAYSYDLIDWEMDDDPLYRAGGHPRGLDAKYAHKISLIWDEGRSCFFMFYCAVDEEGNRGIALLTSRRLIPE